jgi:hypothetical protein
VGLAGGQAHPGELFVRWDVRAGHGHADHPYADPDPDRDADEGGPHDHQHAAPDQDPQFRQPHSDRVALRVRVAHPVGFSPADCPRVALATGEPDYRESGPGHGLGSVRDLG